MTTTTVPSKMPEDFALNIDNLDKFSNSTSPTFIDRLGISKRTLAGVDAEAEARMNANDGTEAAALAVRESLSTTQRNNFQSAADLVLAGAGYAPPVAYTAGLSMTLPVQTVNYLGQTYAPILSALPFTTSGTFEAAKFRLIQGVAQIDLVAEAGGAMVGLPALGASDTPGTVTEEARRKAVEVRLLGHAPTTQPAPRYSVLSTIADGQISNAFPSVARYEGFDYVFYRAGVGHEGNDGVIKVHKVNLDTGLLDSTTMVLDLAFDSRDPCVLTDDYGRAVLVGGKMKVVVFHAASRVATKVTVYDLDPANLEAGMVNPVDLPVGIVAAKTDVKPLAAGGYGLVGYNTIGCYWLTTLDWLTFTIELIGAGNECAWAEEFGGTLVVIARQEAAPYHAKMYKKPLGGVWALHSTLPLRLAAPALRKLPTIMAYNNTPSTTGQHGGWLLLAKDRRESPSMNALDNGAMRLVAMISRNAKGTVLNDFALCQDLMATHQTSVKTDPTGDSFYANAVTSPFSPAVTIYSHMQTNADAFQPYGSYAQKIIRIAAKFQPGIGLVTQTPSRQPENQVLNGNFNSLKHWSVGQNSAIASSRLTITGTCTNPSNNQVVKLKAGQYRLFLRVRRVSGDGDAQGHHLNVKVNGAAAALLSTVYLQGTAAQLGTDFHIVRGLPFDMPTDGACTLQITAPAGTATSEIDWVYIGKADELFEFVDTENVEKVIVATVDFGGTTGGTPVFTGTYSASFWGMFVIARNPANRPLPFLTEQEATESLRLLSLTDTNGGAMTLRSLTVNTTTWTVNLVAERASWQAGAAVGSPLTARIECRYRAVE